MGILTLIFFIWFFVFGGWAVVGNFLAAAFPFIVMYIIYSWVRYTKEEENQRKRNQNE